MPQNLTLALGTLQVTPLEIATGYAVFANGGFRVQPVFRRPHRKRLGRGGLPGFPAHRLRGL